MGEPSDRVFDEMTAIVPLTKRAARVAIDHGTRHPISGSLQFDDLWKSSGLSGAERADTRIGASG